MKMSGIGGQAVIEGILMRNREKYAIAVRKPDQEIEVTVKKAKMLDEKYKWMKLPFIRGIYNFLESLIIGMSAITYSGSLYDDPEEQKSTKLDSIGKTIFKDKLEAILMAVTVIFSIIIAVVLFMVIPYAVSRLLTNIVSSQTLLNFIEGMVRLVIFFLYLFIISNFEEIKRNYMYHGAEHKCINCIENGAPLTVENVMNSSRFHKRCGTSFIFIVMMISIILFIFIKVDNTALQIGIRFLMIPVIAGISYEILRFFGKHDNKMVRVLVAPGFLLQRMTTKEPDESMAEVAIKAVEAVYDWRVFLEEYYEDVPLNQVEEEIKKSERALALSASGKKRRHNTRKVSAKEAADLTAELEKKVEVVKKKEEDALAGFELEDAPIIEDQHSERKIYENLGESKAKAGQDEEKSEFVIDIPDDVFTPASQVRNDAGDKAIEDFLNHQNLRERAKKAVAGRLEEERRYDEQKKRRLEEKKRREDKKRRDDRKRVDDKRRDSKRSGGKMRSDKSSGDKKIKADSNKSNSNRPLDRDKNSAKKAASNMSKKRRKPNTSRNGSKERGSDN